MCFCIFILLVFFVCTHFFRIISHLFLSQCSRQALTSFYVENRIHQVGEAQLYFLINLLFPHGALCVHRRTLLSLSVRRVSLLYVVAKSHSICRTSNNCLVSVLVWFGPESAQRSPHYHQWFLASECGASVSHISVRKGEQVLTVLRIPPAPSWTIELFLKFIGKVIFVLLFVGYLYYDVTVKIMEFQKKKQLDLI